MTQATTDVVGSPTGNFNFRTLASRRKFDAAELNSDNPPLPGLERESIYLWGSVRDDEGLLYSVIRRIPSPGGAIGNSEKSLAGKLLVVASGSPKGQQQLRREPAGSVDSTDIRRVTGDADAVEYGSVDGADGRPMHIKFSATDFSYQEQGVLGFRGHLAVPPMQWYIPTPTSSTLYATQTYFIDGELFGRPVRGFFFWEECWMVPGGQLYHNNDPLEDAEYLTWYSWANHWPDGTCESGHFLFGENDFHIGLVASSDGSVSAAKTMNVVVTRADDGYWHDGLQYDIDGVKWVCEPDPQGRMEGLGRMPNPQQEGRMHRVDDTRIPDVWMAWGETVPARGEKRRHGVS